MKEKDINYKRSIKRSFRGCARLCVRQVFCTMTVSFFFKNYWSPFWVMGRLWLYNKNVYLLITITDSGVLIKMYRPTEPDNAVDNRKSGCSCSSGDVRTQARFQASTGTCTSLSSVQFPPLSSLRLPPPPHPHPHLPVFHSTIIVTPNTLTQSFSFMLLAFHPSKPGLPEPQGFHLSYSLSFARQFCGRNC